VAWGKTWSRAHSSYGALQPQGNHTSTAHICITACLFCLPVVIITAFAKLLALQLGACLQPFNPIKTTPIHVVHFSHVGVYLLCCGQCLGKAALLHLCHEEVQASFSCSGWHTYHRLQWRVLAMCLALTRCYRDKACCGRALFKDKVLFAPDRVCLFRCCCMSLLMLK
jgi:hypothetical protein